MGEEGVREYGFGTGVPGLHTYGRIESGHDEGWKTIKPQLGIAKLGFVLGAHEGIRTPNLLIRSVTKLLYKASV